jgi:hypothetical protein
MDLVGLLSSGKIYPVAPNLWHDLEDKSSTSR